MNKINKKNKINQLYKMRIKSKNKQKTMMIAIQRMCIYKRQNSSLMEIM